jgi:small subunit ribosomal protein S8
MSHDIISDILNKIMNAKRAGKSSIEFNIISKPMIKLIEIAKENGYIKSFVIDGKKITLEIGDINMCGTIKPRHYVKQKGIEKYMRRYLPAKDMGIIIISTNKGMMTHYESIEKNIGGALIAYFY